MGTSNFYYKNRCVVVTNDDYEIGNIPPYEDSVNDNRNFPSFLIKDFDFWMIVITAGYYEGACIDYIEHTKRSASDVVTGYIGYPWTKRELFLECKKSFNISRRKMQKICGNVGDMDIDTYVERSIEEIGKYLMEKEEREVNAYIDSLKDKYGYEELGCIGHMSNGEAVYYKVG